VVVIDKGEDAVYKGLAIASTPSGERLYATNFLAGTVEVYDGAFHPVSASGGFVDPKLPPGYAPFGIQVIADRVYVTYALQDADKHDDVAGKHHGFVDAFTREGELVRRVASGGKLDSPWGVAIAPADFGRFSMHLLVGNFGDGHLIAFDVDGRDGKHGKDGKDDCEDEGPGESLQDVKGPMVIDGLWGIGFGNGNRSGALNTLYFASGPDDENHGIFGRVDAAN
jgi:uncharacterized protein (TIGR03118 family)